MSTDNPLLAALAASPEVRPGTGSELIAAHDAQQLDEAADAIVAAIERSAGAWRASEVMVVRHLGMRAAERIVRDLADSARGTRRMATAGQAPAPDAACSCGALQRTPSNGIAVHDLNCQEYIAARRQKAVAEPLSLEWLGKIRARHAAAEGGHWHLAPEPHTDPDLVRTMVSGWCRYIGVLRFHGHLAAENRQFVLYAHDDVRDLLAEIDWLRFERNQWEATVRRLAGEDAGESTPPDTNDGDEFVGCSGLHCRNGEWFRHLTEGGWTPGAMGTWQCPSCAAPGKDTYGGSQPTVGESTQPGTDSERPLTEAEIAEALAAHAQPDTSGEAWCARCGCTENRPCEGGCSWVPNLRMEDLCSACTLPDGSCATPGCGLGEEELDDSDPTVWGWTLLRVAGSEMPARWCCSPWCVTAALEAAAVELTAADQDDHGSIEDVYSAAELHEMDQTAEFAQDAADDAANTAAVEADERGDA